MSTIRRDESGLAAITVTLIILGIVTLITVGFATLMRREQRQALDRQLSTQAFYAAESGVNLARKAIDADLAVSETPETYSNCSDSPIVNYDLGNNASVSCVLADLTPTELTKTLDPSSSWTTKIESANGMNITKLKILQYF